MRVFILIVVLHGSLFSFGQKPTAFDPNVKTIYISNDTTQNFYLALEPEVNVKGLLVILAGFGGHPNEVLEETDLPEKARKDGYLVVIPYLSILSFYDDSLSQQRLTALIPEVINKYKIPNGRFIIGGHSAGGNGALLYAENAYRLNNKNVIKPNVVFGVDPPLDMKRLWNTFSYLDKIDFHKAATDESRYFLNRFRQQIGGTPSENPGQYEKISSFYRDAPNGGKIGYLKSVPIRLYCDPDIQWYIENRRESYEQLNASDLSACIVQLRLLGNNRAELITNIGKGYFPGGVRHPHGFSQLNADEFLLWANKVIDKK